MITPKMLASAFARNTQIIKEQTAGLSHFDSLIQLPFRANCLNWTLGHILTNRQRVLQLLGASLPLAADFVPRYGHGSAPVLAEGPGVHRLEEMLTLLEQSQTQINNLLEQASPEALEEPVAVFGDRKQPVFEGLFFLYFHDSYHTGQTEILRQAAGKNDAII